tara:strand:- start:500 stop:769 length:270 start_codon:yes stop_codon:yes gene_type:complete
MRVMESSKGRILANKLKLNVGRSPEVRTNYWTGGDNKVHLVRPLANKLGFIAHRKGQYNYFLKHEDGSNIYLTYRNIKGVGSVHVYDNS